MTCRPTSQQDEYHPCISDNMVELVQKLCVSISTRLDHLLSCLVTMKEHYRLTVRQCCTEQERCRMLLCDVLDTREMMLLINFMKFLRL